jgi:Ca-activated chloride channel homolog
MRPIQHRVLPALLLVGILAAPVALFADAASVRARISAAQASYDKCVAEKPGDAAHAKKCHDITTKELAAIEAEINKTLAKDAAASALRSEVSAARSAVAKKNTVATKADKKPKEPAKAKKLEDGDDNLSAKMDAAPAPEMRESKRKAMAPRGKTSGAVARPSVVRPMPKPSPGPVPRPDPAEPQGSEDYKNYGVNPMTETSKDALSTFSIDVDTGAYTIARKKLMEGQLPPAASVRVEEFVNYFRYDLPQPKSGVFSVTLDAAPSPFTAEKNMALMRVGVQGKLQDIKSRKPVHLTFLVDVSGSMSSQDKLPLAKQALKILISNLKDGDTVALVTYAGATKIVLEPTGIAQRGRIIAALEDLTSGGGTGMGTGMELAYKMALQNHKRDHVNRVIVLSDGDANIGPSSHEDMLKQIKAYVDEGVTMSTIGLGMGNYKDTMMEQLANKGNGNYYYIDSIQEARKVFGEQIGGTLEVIAKDVKLQVEFNPKAIKKYRLVGYENRDIADQDFRNDKVDAGELGAGHTVTALYEVELVPGSAEDTMATVRIRHKKPEGATATEAAFPMLRKDFRGKLSDAPRDLQFAAAVVAFAEILRGSPYAKNINYDLVLELAQASSSAKEADRTEFMELVRKAKALSKK